MSSDLIWVTVLSAFLLSLLIFRQYRLRRQNEALLNKEARYERAIKGANDGVWEWNIETDEFYFSPQWKALLGFNDAEIDNVKSTFIDRIFRDERKPVVLKLKAHLNSLDPFDIQLRLRHKDGSFRWFRLVGQAGTTRDGKSRVIAGAMSDIGEIKLNELMDRSRRQVLTLTAKGKPTKELFKAIIDNIELEMPEVICSILKLDIKKGEIYCESAPRLSQEFISAIDGTKLGDRSGAFINSVLAGKRVIVEQIQTNPDWDFLRPHAKEAGLISCWSEPLFNAKDEVIGIFSLYHHYPAVPSAIEMKLIEHAAVLAGIVMEKAKTEEALQLASLVYENSSEAMLIFGDDRSILAVNPAFTEISGYEPEDVLGKQADVLNSEFYEQHFYDAMSLGVGHTGQWQGEVKDRRKNGEIYYKWLTINTIYNEDGSVHRRVALFSDITERKKSEKIIWEQANYDFLTNLPNRNMFHERLEQEIKKASRDGRRFALLLIDLDRFKEVNDTLGHDYGDILLIDAAKRISESVRESDTVARLGGDEFTIILSEIDEHAHVEIIAQKIIEKLSRPFQLKEEVAYVSASIGITLYPQDSGRIEELLKNADQAMYEAKNLGRNRYQYFTHSMQEAAQQRMRLVSDLRNAIERQEFSLYFQPVVDLKTGKVIKAEALIRWNHPSRGIIPPGEFIEVAEETGLIVQIGQWVIQEALDRVVCWRKSIAPDFQISVNTSPAQYQANSFDKEAWARNFSRIEENGQAIVMEITEGMMMDASPLITEQLLAFRNSGIQVALDDFGTGYSSLSYLRRFDIDYIKIDRSFVKNLEFEEEDRILCEAIIVMAHKLKLKVIAEGVENKPQLLILKSIGCDYAQGYYISPPVDQQTFEHFALQGHPFENSTSSR
ncbi:EAL domain-containing protein [Aliikangiella sp. G2MR2-5]|uniref:bifunctional diguanylate cyclase/phosphodiesterase n=1 Tax=Aliikangiella sp. G2MR2-5 TaxID=2788943 RepID=UPI0018AC3B4A|nr:EAL domain-containing protein [Aliikangiella sp. G2MR2-5]